MDYPPYKRIAGITLVMGVFLAYTVQFAAGQAPVIHGVTTIVTATSTVQNEGVTRDTLQAQIDARSKELDSLNTQIKETQKNLLDTTKQRVGLQGELNSLQGNINHLNLGIKADQITVEKLNLQMQSLNYDLGDIKISIANKQAGIMNTMSELQKNDATESDFLYIILKNKSLADGVLEAQNLSDLQHQLAGDIENLKNLNDQYNQKIKLTASTKNQIDNEQKDLTNKKLIVEDQKQTRQTLLVQTKNKESVYQTQVNDLKKRQQQIAQDIEALDAVLRAKIDPATLPALGSGVLAIPVQGDAKTSVTQGYGGTDFAKNGYQGHWHNGIDFAAAIGTPILAAEDGTVLASGNQDSYCPRGAYGKFIVINQNNNLTTLYGHLSRQVVQKGDKVKRGDIIGYSGKTGYATGPHLHFTVFAQATFYMGPSRVCGPMPYGGDLNPLGYL